MRDIRDLPDADENGADGGLWLINLRGQTLHVIASWGGGWDHVSVSHARRVPTWEEMERICRMFFKPDETVMQLHVPTARHINVHEFCLHLWRPQGLDIPTPPPAH